MSTKKKKPMESRKRVKASAHESKLLAGWTPLEEEPLYRRIACKMLGEAFWNDVREAVRNDLDSVDVLIRNCDGEIASRQVIASVIVAANHRANHRADQENVS